MFWRKILFATALLASPGVARAGGDPVASIRAIYDAYVAAEKSGKDAPDMYTPAYYSARIDKLVAEMLKLCPNGEVCGPDYDFLVDGQDFQIRDVKIALLSRDGEKAKVEAKFNNFEAAVDKIFWMVEEGGAWRIDDVETRGENRQNLGATLVEALKSLKN